MAENKKEKVQPEVKKPDYYALLDKGVINGNEVTTLGHQTGAGVILLVMTKLENGEMLQSLSWINHARIDPYMVHGEIEHYDLVGGQ